MNPLDADKWSQAFEEEFKGLTEMGIWKLVPRPKYHEMIKCRWTYMLKSDDQYKAQLVTKEFTQVQGIGYEETFSPVARYESIGYLLTHTALLGKSRQWMSNWHTYTKCLKRKYTWNNWKAS